MILEGKTLAKNIREALPARAEAVAKKLGRPIRMVGIGFAKAAYCDFLYLQKEVEAAKKTGINAEIVDLDENITYDKFLAIIKQLSADNNVDAILIPKPLPKHLDTLELWENIAPAKDIDGAATLNMGRLFVCKNWKEVTAMQGFAPATAMAAVRLLEHYNIEVAGKEVAVIGRSATVGKPLAHMLTCKDATVKICHSKTKDLKNSLKDCEIVLCAVGKARFLKKDMLRPGAIVIDIGTNQDENGVFCGDVDFENVKDAASSITPVPGGVGPVTLAILLENIILSGSRKIS